MVEAQAMIQRDERFWQSAYEEHGGAVLSFLRRRVPKGEQAEDLLQETFVRAMRFDSFQGGNLRGYLLRISRHLIVNQLRRPKVVVPHEPPLEDQQPFESVEAEGDSPEEVAAWSHLNDELQRALATLRPDHRRAFELAVLGQHSYPEVAEITGWSLAKVKSNVHRARKKLIATLEHRLPDAAGATR